MRGAAERALVSEGQAGSEWVSPCLTGPAARHMYLNFADTRRDPADFWSEQAYRRRSEQAYRRLRRIKTTVDPDDLFRSNHSIEPAR